VLLLAHEPDFADQAVRAPHRLVLQLSGHSHGGQVNLPLLGRPILPWLGRKYPAGLRTVPDSNLQDFVEKLKLPRPHLSGMGDLRAPERKERKKPTA
jgi:hypothetical protein